METESLELNIRGLFCRSCAEQLEEALLHSRGVLRVRVSYWKGRALVDYDPALSSRDTLEAVVRGLGYSTGKRSPAALVLDLLCLAAVGLLAWRFSAPGHSAGTFREGLGAGSLFLLGLSVSPHCMGMCGGVLLGAVSTARSRAGQRRAALAYNGGRVLAYTALGALFGGIGAALVMDRSVQSMVFTLLGLGLFLLGLNMWGLLPGLGTLLPAPPCRLPEGAKRRGAGQPLLIGLLTGLMPCGTLYALWFQAAAAGSPIRGGLYALCFSLGTALPLFLFGAFGAFLPRSWHRVLAKLSALLVTGMGLKMLLTGLRLLS